MLREEITKILQKIQQQRPVKEEVTLRGSYSEKKVEAIYNDSEQLYEVQPPLKPEEEVTTVESFRDYIKEELSRRGKTSGKLATVSINKNGGRFVADDDFQQGKCVFRRSLSEQWLTFKNCIGESFSHEEFLRLMQKLSPSIVGFKDLYPDLLDIRVIGRAENVSKPYYVKGESQSGVQIKFKMRGGEDENIILPEHITLKLPYAKGKNDKTYTVDADLVYENSYGIQILVQAPLFEQVEEMALLDETEFLKKELSKYPDLLVLFNY